MDPSLKIGPRTLITTLAKQAWVTRPQDASAKPVPSTISGVHSNHTRFAPGTYSPPISYSHQAYSYPRQADPLMSQSFDASHDVERFSESFQYVLSTVTWCIGCIFHVSMSGPNLTTPLNIFQQHQKRSATLGLWAWTAKRCLRALSEASFFSWSGNIAYESPQPRSQISGDRWPFHLLFLVHHLHVFRVNQKEMQLTIFSFFQKSLKSLIRNPKP